MHRDTTSRCATQHAERHFLANVESGTKIVSVYRLPSLSALAGTCKPSGRTVFGARSIRSDGADRRPTVKMLHKFHSMISRGQHVPDPNEPVELVVVRGTSGPMTVARLRDGGFDAVGYETNFGTGLACEYRILIPRRQLEPAAALLNTVQ